MRKCDSTECNGEATHTLMWTDGWHKYCLPCAMKLVGIGDLLGFPARQSLRILTLDELEDESDTPTD